jgi:putative endonuclease
MDFRVYVIRSLSTRRLYIGHTMHLNKRLKEHNDPESFSSRFTKRIPGPWILVHSERFPTRSEAYRRERWLKTGKGREYLNEILKPSGC